ncbi:MAG TPA: hypothetical protein VGG12_08530 [Methylovirgula sp.]|jgi:hypothetical protein
MMNRDQDRETPRSVFSADDSKKDHLAYQIEIWDKGGQAVERVLARAVDASLARAIFMAVTTENPERRVVLRRGDHVLFDSSEK